MTYDKTWSTGEENGKPLQHSRLENAMNSLKKIKDLTFEIDPEVDSKKAIDVLKLEKEVEKIDKFILEIKQTYL